MKSSLHLIMIGLLLLSACGESARRRPLKAKEGCSQAFLSDYDSVVSSKQDFEPVNHRAKVTGTDTDRKAALEALESLVSRCESLFNREVPTCKDPRESSDAHREIHSSDHRRICDDAKSELLSRTFPATPDAPVASIDSEGSCTPAFLSDFSVVQKGMEAFDQAVARIRLSRADETRIHYVASLESAVSQCARFEKRHPHVSCRLTDGSDRVLMVHTSDRRAGCDRLRDELARVRAGVTP